MLQLEPMPALERRWIHLALRDNAGVATQSIGEEPNRRVVVLPRSNRSRAAGRVAGDGLRARASRWRPRAGARARHEAAGPIRPTCYDPHPPMTTVP